MNAANSLPDDSINNPGSDSDTNADEVPDYYQPISASVDSEDDDDIDDHEELNQDNRAADPAHLENGHCFSTHESGSWISSEEDEEETVAGESSDSAAVRALEEDVNRRNAPLTAENTTRVMEAMRGISFGGSAPEWAVRVPETQWIDQIRRMRQMPQPSGSSGD